MLTQLQVWFSLLITFLARRKVAIAAAVLLTIVALTLALPDGLVFAGPIGSTGHCPGC